MVNTIFNGLNIHVSMATKLKHVNTFFREKRNYLVNIVCSVQVFASTPLLIQSRNCQSL